jgi:hypothetical protein
MDIVNAVSINKTLVYLDLGYNGLGNDAGELMVHKDLVQFLRWFIDNNMFACSFAGRFIDAKSYTSYSSDAK